MVDLRFVGDVLTAPSLSVCFADISPILWESLPLGKAIGRPMESPYGRIYFFENSELDENDHKSKKNPLKINI